MKRRCEAALGRDEGGVALHPVNERLARRVTCRHRRRFVGASIDFVTKNGGYEVGALRKMSVERGNADASPVGDGANRRIDAFRGKYIQRGFQQCFDVALRIGPDRSTVRGFDASFFDSADHSLFNLVNGSLFHI